MNFSCVLNFYSRVERDLGDILQEKCLDSTFWKRNIPLLWSAEGAFHYKHDISSLQILQSNLFLTKSCHFYVSRSVGN